METLSKEAVSIINAYRENDTIMRYLTKEAWNKAATDFGLPSGHFLKRVEHKHPEAADRVSKYIEAGLLGCYLALIQSRKSIFSK